MEMWTATPITDESPQQGPLTSDNLEQYTLEVKEGEGVNLTLISGPYRVPYSGLAKGDVRKSEIDLPLHGLGYSVSEHTGPFEVVIAYR